MRIPLVQGRFFTDADWQTTAQPVAIIDEKFAQRFWPAGDAIGKHVWNDPERKLTIVGVVGTVKQYGLDVDGRLVAYRPGPWAGYQVARTSSPDPASVARDMIRKIREIDPTITVFDVQTMPSQDVGLDGSPALLDADAGIVRGVRADPGDCRRLRRDVAPGGAGRARHRRADGAGRGALAHPAHGAPPGTRADGRRQRSRSARRRRADARDGEPAVRRQHH